MKVYWYCLVATLNNKVRVYLLCFRLDLQQITLKVKLNCANLTTLNGRLSQILQGFGCATTSKRVLSFMTRSKIPIVVNTQIPQLPNFCDRPHKLLVVLLDRDLRLLPRQCIENTGNDPFSLNSRGLNYFLQSRGILSCKRVILG